MLREELSDTKASSPNQQARRDDEEEEGDWQVIDEGPTNVRPPAHCQTSGIDDGYACPGDSADEQPESPIGHRIALQESVEHRAQLQAAH
jgi:hypothetical protein